MIDEQVATRRPDAGVLAAWVTAWLQGRVAGDDVVSALHTVRTHRVLGLPDSAGDEPWSAALVAWRRRGTDTVRLVLPVPGDVRGVPTGDAAFTAAALDVGQALVGGGLGLVPTVAGSGELLVWHAYEVGPTPPDPITVREAEVDLAAAMRECASALTESGSGGRTTAAAWAGLAATRRAGDRLDLPPGHPGPAAALLAQALRLRAVLDLAVSDPVGGAYDRHGMAARALALRPLATAVRRARIAACNAAAEPARTTS